METMTHRRIAPALLLALSLAALTLPALLDMRADAAPQAMQTDNILQVAREFLREHRYLEAISLLRERLAVMPAGEQRLPLLLLLADGLMGVGDLAGAEGVLKEAEKQAVTAGQMKAVEKRRENLEKLRLKQPPQAPPAEAAPPSQAAAIPFQPGTIPVTNSFFETDIRQVLTDLSMETGIPILWDATVQGLVTYEAQEKPLDDVLKAILLPMGFTYSFEDGAYYVGSAKPEDPAFGLLSKTEVVTLSNVDATEAIGMLSDFFKKYVKASKSSNMVCITAPPNWIERIKADLIELDAPPAQILIEVIVTEIASDALREMGLDWSLTGLKDNPTWELTNDNTNIESPPILWNYTELGAKVGDYTVDLAASLEMLMQSGKAKIRANPRITTMNGRPAQISITKDQYFIIQTGSSQYYQYNTLQAVSSGIKLEITPYAAASGEITVYVKPQVGDVVGKGANDLPEISTRAANTSVRVKNGETFSIGGLSLQQEKNVQKKLPLLGDIPILGYLFRYDRLDVKETEIIIFITPHLLKD
jgi:type IV pilus assembly protein PilQ